MSTTAILVLGGALVLLGYVPLILAPTWRSYGRIWERLAASALTLYLLASLVVIGVAIGVAVFWSSRTLL